MGAELEGLYVGESVLVGCSAGLIGSTVARQFIAETDATVINGNLLTYADNLEPLAEARELPRYVFGQVEIRNRVTVDGPFRKHTAAF